MPKGLPRSKSANAPQPLGKPRLENVPLVHAAAFRAKQQRKDDKTGEEYEVDQVKLSLDFDSGEMQHNADGEPITDDDGKPKPHYINLGFVTLTGSAKGNLVDILKALGFNGPNFIEEEGGNAGGLRDDVDVQMEFGTNGLGHNYEGSEYDDLPEYDYRDKNRPDKRKLEVPITSWTINGYQVIGRRVDMAMEVKNGYDKPTAFIVPRDPEPLRTPEEEGEEAIPATRPKAAAAGPKGPDEPEPTGKGQKYVWRTLDELQVPVEYRTAILRKFTADPSIKNIASLDINYCRIFKDAFKEDPTIVKQFYEAVTQGDSDDDFDDDDEEF